MCYSTIHYTVQFATYYAFTHLCFISMRFDLCVLTSIHCKCVRILKNAIIGIAADKVFWLKE